MSRTRSRTLCLLLFEGALACMCGIAAVYIRFDGDEAREILVDQNGWAKIMLATAIVQASFYLFDLYDFGMIQQRLALYVRILQALGFASIALAAVFYAVPEMKLGRSVFALSLLLMLTVMTCWRLFARWIIGHPRMAERVLILGTDQNAINLAREVLERREQGYEVIGFVGDNPALVGESLINPRVIGLTSELEELVHRHRVDRIVVAIDQRRGRLPLDSLLKLKMPDVVAIEESVSFYERLTGKVSIEMLRPSWLIFAGKTTGMRVYKRARRLVDLVSALVGLTLALPDHGVDGDSGQTRLARPDLLHPGARWQAQ